MQWNTDYDSSMGAIRRKIAAWNLRKSKVLERLFPAFNALPPRTVQIRPDGFCQDAGLVLTSTVTSRTEALERDYWKN
ncbi:MAG: hypothetical protein OXI05_05520 [Bacteroidota bacterium]|nr:hypothetical protein [Bacteroidota bacterium]MXW14067.1 hypothetical protein [Rhodothermaceae bacterium]MDE2645279.1 hypothetical protein [Bacteroidota bacterium]MXW33125.1 hypothetical protein [Rhodothermaceae bacterium]MYC03601.1 hypothetical protein [Rhodothermaceae bacterium]